MANKKLLLEYANLKLEQKRIENNIELLKDQVLQEILQIRGDSDQPVSLAELPGCTFTVTARKTWVYSEYIKDAEKVIKARKEDEQADGTAIYTETHQLMFLTPKE